MQHNPQLTRLKPGIASQGFTLIELIVSLVIVAFVATMLVNFMGTSVTRSAEPVLLARQGAYLNSIMETMTADYNASLLEGTTLNAFMDRVGNEDSTQTRYSHEDHPYTIVHNRLISFDGDPPTDEKNDPDSYILKVTIDYRGSTLTTLFSGRN